LVETDGGVGSSVVDVAMTHALPEATRKATHCAQYSEIIIKLRIIIRNIDEKNSSRHQRTIERTIDQSKIRG